MSDFARCNHADNEISDISKEEPNDLCFDRQLNFDIFLKLIVVRYLEKRRCLFLCKDMELNNTILQDETNTSNVANFKQNYRIDTSIDVVAGQQVADTKLQTFPEGRGRNRKRGTRAARAFFRKFRCTPVLPGPALNFADSLLELRVDICHEPR